MNVRKFCSGQWWSSLTGLRMRDLSENFSARVSAELPKIISPDQTISHRKEGFVVEF